MTPAVRDLSRVLRDRLVTDLHDLLAIPSVGGTAHEAEAQSWVAGRLRDLGLPVRSWQADPAHLTSLPGAPGSEVLRHSLTGVVASLPESAAARGADAGSVLLLGHTDVVPAADWPGAFRPRVGDTTATGRGAADMKGGVAGMIHVARVLIAAGVTPRRALRIATVSAEEDGGLGAFDLLHHVQAETCLIPEPTSGEIVVANAGALGFRITLHGRSAHAARRWEGIDGVELVAAVQHALRRLEAQDAAGADPLLRRWPVPHPTSIGTIAGGDWASTVMATVTLTGRYGVPLDLPVDQARARFEAAVADAVAGVAHDARAEVAWEGGQFVPARLDPRHPLVGTLSSAHRLVTGTAPAVTGATYGTDLRLVLGAGIPAVCYGPGDAEQAHSVGEQVSVDAILQWVDVVLTWLLAR